MASSITDGWQFSTVPSALPKLITVMLLIFLTRRAPNDHKTLSHQGIQCPSLCSKGSIPVILSLLAMLVIGLLWSLHQTPCVSARDNLPQWAKGSSCLSDTCCSDTFFEGFEREVFICLQSITMATSQLLSASPVEPQNQLVLGVDDLMSIPIRSLFESYPGGLCCVLAGNTISWNLEEHGAYAVLVYFPLACLFGT